MSGANLPVRYAPGINPEPDETKQNTVHIIDGDNIRFYRGDVEKIGGHKEEALSNSISGVPRAKLSVTIDGVTWEIIGTHSRLYAKRGGEVTNITPLQTSTDTLGNDPISTLYDDAQTTPLTTVNGSTLVAVSTALYSFLDSGDTLTIANIVGTAGALNGIPVAELNTSHTVVDKPGAYVRIRVSTAATSSGSPTEAASVFTAKLFKITESTHGRVAGERIKLAGATGPIGGIATSEINKEHVIRLIETANRYLVECTTSATSLVAGGGNAVTIQSQIDAGGADAVVATGPGIGTPGLGLPGEIFTDDSLFVQPRIWWQDMFGETWVGGPGANGPCYSWDFDTDVAPVAISNAPTADWGWVEDAKLVTLLGNRVKNSDVGTLTSWTPGAASSAYEDDKEDASQLIGRAFANGENLIFDDAHKMFRMRWVDGTLKWQWKQVDIEDRILGPYAYVSHGGIIYLFCEKNLYAYNGGLFTPLPGNTLFKYLYDDLNTTQRRKCFLWLNHKYFEITGHYPSADSDENDRAIIHSLTEGHWSKRDSIDRTAADMGGVLSYPSLCSSDGNIYQHEVGVDDGTSAMNSFYQVAFSATKNGQFYTEIYGMEPDMTLTGTMTIELYGKDRAREAGGTLLESFSFTESDTKIDCEQEARWHSWLYRSNEVGGYFRAAPSREFVQKGSEF